MWTDHSNYVITKKCRATSKSTILQFKIFENRKSQIAQFAFILSFDNYKIGLVTSSSIDLIQVKGVFQGFIVLSWPFFFLFYFLQMNHNTVQRQLIWRQTLIRISSGINSEWKQTNLLNLWLIPTTEFFFELKLFFCPK